MSNQLHAGNKSHDLKKKLWHTDSKGLYWSGSMHYRTPQELLFECESTIYDLLINHPELQSKYTASHAELVEALEKIYAETTTPDKSVKVGLIQTIAHSAFTRAQELAKAKGER